jgi:hypothetical protein
MKSNKINTNGRIYPKEVLQNAIYDPKFQESLKNSEILGYMGQEIKLDNSTHIVKDIYFIDDDVYAEIEPLPLSKIQKLNKLIDQGSLDLALRGVGDVKYDDEKSANIVTSLSILSVDLVEKSSTVKSIYDILPFLKVGDVVSTEYGDGKVVNVFGYRGSGYGVKVDINGIEYTFERKFR